MPHKKSGAAAKRGKKLASGGGKGSGRRGGNELPAFNSLLSNIAEREQDRPKTLQDLARNKQHSSHAWSTDAKLRNATVKFVSSGTYTPVDPLEDGAEEIESPNQLSEPQRSFQGLSIQDNVKNDEPKLQTLQPRKFQESDDLANLSDTLNHTSHSEAQHDSFYVDLQGNTSLVGDQVPMYRPSSPTPSHSSEEVVLFKGRKMSHRHKNIKGEGDTRTPEADTLSSPDHDRALLQPLASRSSEDELQPRTTRSKQPFKGDINSDAEIIEDYIENLRASGELGDLLETGQIPARELDIHLTGPSSSTLPDALDARVAWTRTELQDLDDLSTSFTCLESVYAVLSKRTRPSGLQYLIVWEGYTVDDARWIPHSSLNSPEAERLIAQFEADELQIPEVAEDEISSSEEEDDESSISIDDLIESGEDTDDEDLWQRRAERLTDEKIARLLAKQEELGMGSESLKILDDDSGDDIEDAAFSTKRNKSSKRARNSQKGKNSRRRWNEKANLMEMDLDEMFEDADDFGMASFGQRTKQPKSNPFDFITAEYEQDAALQATWAKDKQKKKLQKQEREKLRAQGLLGSKNGKPDLKAKYPEVITPQEVVDEIINFLGSGFQSLALPPMGNKERKNVHDIARPFSLKSKSVGSGLNRFPVLYKTRDSGMIDEDMIDSIVNSLRRRLPRMSNRGKGNSTTPRRTGGGGNDGVRYRDGDIVGAAAPELGVENKGRAMLEKMGWSKGTALGALNNKGILQPVVHVVKTSKAGLR